MTTAALQAPPAPWSAEWMADWDRLPYSSRNALECMFDGPIPHQAVIDELRRVGAALPAAAE